MKKINEKIIGKLLLAAGIPFYFPQGTQWLLIAVGLTAVTGGSSFLASLFKTIRFKKNHSRSVDPACFSAVYNQRLV